MFILAGILVFFSLIFCAFSKTGFSEKIIPVFKNILTVYLSVILFKYGIDKVFKAQFYLPEPNILYSKFGNLDKDILFWATMGTSRFYSVSTGFIEVFAAVLLVFRKTEILGLLFSLGIFLNVFLINLGFDISVKLFSFILLLLSFYLLENHWSRIFNFLILKQKEQLYEEAKSKYQPWLAAFRTLVLGLVFVKIIMPYLVSGNYNDDTSQRPYLHGAYKIIDETSPINYIFFHRRNYLILMDKNDKMLDFHYEKTNSESVIILEDYYGTKTKAEVFYRKKDSILFLKFNNIQLKAKKRNWREMNALKPNFHTYIENL